MILAMYTPKPGRLAQAICRQRMLTSLDLLSLLPLEGTGRLGGYRIGSAHGISPEPCEEDTVISHDCRDDCDIDQQSNRRVCSKEAPNERHLPRPIDAQTAAIYSEGENSH